ncbi:MAG: sugar transferase [Armatimonadota bacterium]
MLMETKKESPGPRGPAHPPRAVSASRSRRGRDSAARRLLDLVGASCGLAIAAPLLLMAAIGVRLNMGPPVLFRQRRLGRHEQPFVLLKFRTMLPPQEGVGRPLTASQRLTPTGRILRQLSIDELPQLWNVLRGEMSLVGPRPLYVEYLPYYTSRERIRHEVRPGLTGLAQISGRNRAVWDERLEMDARYVEESCLMLDLRILMRTVVRVLRRADVMDTAIQGSLAKHRQQRRPASP